MTGWRLERETLKRMVDGGHHLWAEGKKQAWGENHHLGFGWDEHEGPVHCVSRDTDSSVLNARVPLALGPTETLNSSIIYQQAQGSRTAPGWASQLEQDDRPFVFCLLGQMSSSWPFWGIWQIPTAAPFGTEVATGRDLKTRLHKDWRQGRRN